MRGLFVLVVLSGCFFKPTAPSDGITDGGADTTVDGDEQNPNANYMFVTSTTTPLGGLTPASADSFCNARAAEVGLAGNFVAWLSASNVNAIDRIGMARGWVRLDHKPFADTPADIAAGNLFYPPRIDEGNNDVGIVQVATGTRSDGTRGSDCSTGSIATGFSDAAEPAWTASGTTVNCGMQARLYCFGTDRSVELAPPVVHGRLAFLSSLVNIDATGTAKLDARCMMDAGLASKTGTFRAFVAMNTKSAQEGWIPGTPWVRGDGVEVATDLDGLLAPINSGADGIRIDPDTDGANAGLVDFGAPDPRTVPMTTQETCQNWTVASTNAQLGESFRSGSIGRAFQVPNSTNCSPRRVYCLQE